MSGATMLRQKPQKTVKISPSGADYTTIQAALDDNTAGGELFEVYPATYTDDTITFTANNQVVKGMSCSPSDVKVTTASSNICDYGAFTGCKVCDVKMEITAGTTLVHTVQGAGGSCNFKRCHTSQVTSYATAGAQPSCYYSSGNGTVKIQEGSMVYNHSGDNAGIIKAAFFWDSHAPTYDFDGVNIDIDGSNASTALTIGYGTGAVAIDFDKCIATVNDTSTGIPAGFYIGGAGTQEFSYNDLHVTGGGTNAYGIYSTSSGNIRGMFNHIHVSGATNNYSYHRGGTATIASQLEDIVADGGVNGSGGTFTYVNSQSDGNWTASGAYTGDVTGDVTGNADTVTTNANLTGIVTSVGNATAIANKAIATAKLADGTDGELITWDSDGVIAHVAAGTATHVLTSNGAGAAPTFQAVAGGGDVSKVGTPVNNQIGIWTGDGTLEGDVDVTYDGTDMLLGATAATTKLQFRDSAVFINSATDGHLDLDADTSIDLNAATNVGGTLALGANNITMSGSIGVTGTRVTKLWTTDLESTNDITVGGTALASTYSPIAGSGSIVTTGALDSGSITSGFGTIDTGSSTITTTGTITGGTCEATADTSAGDNSALGYTATEGAILTGQGSTSDVTIKNDADATVLSIPTGTTTVSLGVDGTASTLTLTEKSNIALDPAGGADGDYSGITITGTAGTNLAFGETVYLAAGDSKWEKTDADATATAGAVLVGIVVVAGNENATVTIMTYGQIRADAAFPALTIGAPVYLADGSAGDIEVTAPAGDTDVVRVVGHALTANEILFNPSPDWIVVTA